MRKKRITIDNVLNYNVRDFREVLGDRDYQEYEAVPVVERPSGIEGDLVLQVFFSDIGLIHEEARKFIMGARNAYSRYSSALIKHGLKRRGVRVSEVREADRDRYKRYAESHKIKTIMNCRHAVSELCTLWDNLGEILWLYYGLDYEIKFRDARFPGLFDYLTDKKELFGFFSRSGVRRGSRGKSYLPEDGVLHNLLQWRNTARHGFIGISRTYGLNFSTIWERYIEFEDGGGVRKRIKVMTPDEWADLTARSYHHFVICYNSLLGAIKNKESEDT